jgi:hypothetical protein
MKKLVLFTAFILGLVFVAKSQVATEAGDPSSMAKFKWEAKVHDFGKIDQGKPVTHEFLFTNAGSTPLVISNVRGSCGCTVTDYTKEPIAPGKTGFVKAIFNAQQ